MHYTILNVELLLNSFTVQACQNIVGRNKHYHVQMLKLVL